MIETGATSSLLELEPPATAAIGEMVAKKMPPSAAPELDPGLLAVTQALNDNFEEMCAAVGERRVIIVRQGGTIQVGTLLAILGSLAVHVGIAVLVFFLWKLIIIAPWRWGPSQSAALASDGGRPGTSFTMLGEGELTGTDPKPYLGPIAAAVQPGAPATVAPPALPNFDPWQSIKGARLQDEPPPLIGLPTNLLDSGPRPLRAPPRPGPDAAAQPLPPGPVLVGPHSAQIAAAPSVAAAQGTALVSGTSSIAKVGGPPGGDSMDGDDEPTINIMRGRGGQGSGEGQGNGEGIDRGASGANNETPGIIYNPQPDLPILTAMKRPHGRAIFEVTVLADGTAGEIKLVHSCGESTIDAVCKTALARWRFRPAYRAGRAFVTTTNIAFTFGGDN